jgi:hypothetical protein
MQERIQKNALIMNFGNQSLEVMTFKDLVSGSISL